MGVNVKTEQDALKYRVENHTETKINTMCVLVAQMQHHRELMEGEVCREGAKSIPHGH